MSVDRPAAFLEDLGPQQWLRLTRRLRAHCAAVALQAGTEASIAGLCAEGALEAASSAIEMLDAETLRRVALADADDAASPS